jgi:hypothetical protein
MLSRIYGEPIAAAIIIIAGFLSLTLFDKTVPSAYAIEQTVEALREVGIADVDKSTDGAGGPHQDGCEGFW